MPSVAIIGTGIAGMGCGYFLHRKYDLAFYEKNGRIGGHTNTVTVDEDGTPIRIDTGFIVYNEITYPNLIRLFGELGVETRLSSMTFSVRHEPSGLEFCGSGFNGLFAQRRNILRPGFLNLLWQINRFNNQCIEILDDDGFRSYTLRDYIREKKYSADFVNKYLIPMSSAIWSTAPDSMLDFPAVTLVRFFKNHGLLGLNTHFQWRTVANGSWAYRDKLIAPFKNRVAVNRPAVKVIREGGKAAVVDASGERIVYDHVILACHADQSLRLLAEPTENEARFLKPFRYQTNVATLHTDASVMPKVRGAWSSWNYRLRHNKEGVAISSVVYYMNSLQQVSKTRDYFISINDAEVVAPEKIIYQVKYEHPVFSLEAISAQKRLPELNKNGVVFFCGSYFNYGFHEDALTSALNLCRTLTGEPIWQ